MKLKTLGLRVKVQPDRLALLGAWRTDKQGSAARGYNYAWQKRREQHLRAYPLCVYCLPRLTPATVADHIVPHRGDQALFDGPIQSLCAACHSSKKQKEEAGG